MWRRVGLDKVVAALVPTGCAALLLEAHFRTDLKGAQSPKDCADSVLQHHIQPHHVRQLEENGIVVLHNVLDKQKLGLARHAIRNLSDKFQDSDNEAEVRQDQVVFVHPNTNGLEDCVHLVRGVASELETHQYTVSEEHLVPRQCQLALYRGDGQSVYNKHLDTCDSTIFELGLLEWLRLSDYRHRVCTVILYLNDAERTIEEGGALQCWLPQSPSCSIEIPPVGGTMVIFQSNLIPHTVLPSSTDRFALTCWISGSLKRNKARHLQRGHSARTTYPV